MEDTLRDRNRNERVCGIGSCLNPYFNGRYSTSEAIKVKGTYTEGLNPYYDGRYSMSSKF